MTSTKLSRLLGEYLSKLTGTVQQVYCDMELECGGHKGGWMRVAQVDTTNGDTCPVNGSIMLITTLFVPEQEAQVATLLTIQFHIVTIRGDYNSLTSDIFRSIWLNIRPL